MTIPDRIREDKSLCERHKEVLLIHITESVSGKEAYRKVYGCNEHAAIYGWSRVKKKGENYLEVLKSEKKEEPKPKDGIDISGMSKEELLKNADKFVSSQANVLMEIYSDKDTPPNVRVMAIAAFNSMIRGKTPLSNKEVGDDTSSIFQALTNE